VRALGVESAGVEVHGAERLECAGGPLWIVESEAHRTSIQRAQTVSIAVDLGV
jgi:hypothetical protein